MISLNLPIFGLKCYLRSLRTFFYGIGETAIFDIFVSLPIDTQGGHI